MTSPGDLLSHLVEVADDLGPLALPAGQDQLTALCATARLALGAAAVSVARIDGEAGELEYLAADGEGSGEIVGTRLATGRGLAGFVAASGQSLAVDQVQSDPRFARDVAESTGYVPTSMLAVPIPGGSDGPAGVLSVLDRNSAGAGVESADALLLASSFAAQAAVVLPRIELVESIGAVLLAALADAVADRDTALADGLRREAQRLSGPDGELAATAALLAELRSRDAATRAAVERVLQELLELSARRCR